jgi:hypothetical protein
VSRPPGCPSGRSGQHHRLPGDDDHVDQAVARRVHHHGPLALAQGKGLQLHALELVEEASGGITHPDHLQHALELALLLAHPRGDAVAPLPRGEPHDAGVGQHVGEALAAEQVPAQRRPVGVVAGPSSGGEIELDPQQHRVDREPLVLVTDAVVVGVDRGLGEGGGAVELRGHEGADVERWHAGAAGHGEDPREARGRERGVGLGDHLPSAPPQEDAHPARGREQEGPGASGLPRRALLGVAALDEGSEVTEDGPRLLVALQLQHLPHRAARREVPHLDVVVVVLEEQVLPPVAVQVSRARPAGAPRQLQRGERVEGAAVESTASVGAGARAVGATGLVVPHVVARVRVAGACAPGGQERAAAAIGPGRIVAAARLRLGGRVALLPQIVLDDAVAADAELDLRERRAAHRDEGQGRAQESGRAPHDQKLPPSAPLAPLAEMSSCGVSGGAGDRKGSAPSRGGAMGAASSKR